MAQVDERYVPRAAALSKSGNRRELREIAVERDCTPGEIAISWVLANPNVQGAITGMRRPEQCEVIGAAEIRLDEIELDRLSAFIRG